MDEVTAARQKLRQGVISFSTEVFPKKKDAYQRLVQFGQAPHTLFITCADSRIDPTTITQSQPGEIFVSRNIGNLVPPYGDITGSGISAVIEYAVAALEVKQIVICGHSDCGAMKGLLNPAQVESFPAVRSWLRSAEAARSHSQPGLLNALTEQNVLLQLRHLQSHPSVAARLSQGAIGLAGWVYDIAHGTIRIYNEIVGNFEAIQ